MLNKLLGFIRKQELLQPGDRVVCAVSGGADSIALLFALYLLREKLEISLCAAHYNHHLRGAESDRDETFVRDFCDRYDIPLFVGSGNVVAGKKGLEAAARDARYGFLKSLSGKIATAHTANDNAETMLMHLVRGTGLKGLGGISPVNGTVIRPILEVTRQEVLDFLQEYNLDYVTDSSNETDQFLRNRLRHRVMPLLEQENPQIVQNLSALALRLRMDEAALSDLTQSEICTDVYRLRKMHPAIRSRVLCALLERWGVPEPEAEHICLAEKLVFSDSPSAKACFPGGVQICRKYNILEKCEDVDGFAPVELLCPGQAEIPELGIQVICTSATTLADEPDCFTVVPDGQMLLRSRQAGDTIQLSGGSKSLKKLFIDKKIPAAQRGNVPVLVDAQGVVGVFGIGANRNRLATELPAFQIRFLEK